MLQQSLRLQRVARAGGLLCSSCRASSSRRFPPLRWFIRSDSKPAREGSKAALRFYGTSKLPFVGDTIYALSTAQGRAGIAVIRISGPACLDVYKGLCPSKPSPKPRYAAVRTLYEPSVSEQPSSAVLDSEALVLYFPGPKTVTGEDVLELHVHGGTATVKAVLSAIPRSVVLDRTQTQPRIRYAEPGEFTKRAFVNDRLDLAQVESLSDTLAAETEQQRRAAIRGSSGSLGRAYEGWRSQLLLARGEIEALIDFSEDQHFDESPADLLSSVAAQVDDILRSIGLHESASQRSELLRSGIRIALLGPPNVGKSSLMNLVVGREASIVSGEAGTTRDIVEASLDIRGFLCSFSDTAGFRSDAPGGGGGDVGAVEKEGIRRARQRALDSDVVVILASVEQDARDQSYIYFDKETLNLGARAESCLIVVNKADAVAEEQLEMLLNQFRREIVEINAEHASATLVPISCKQAQENISTDSADPGNLQHLTNTLVDSFSQMTEMPVDLQDLLGVTERQRQLLAKCRVHLENFLAEARPAGEDDGRDADTVLAAEYLRYAADCLARITGKGEAGDVEDVLGVVFEK